MNNEYEMMLLTSVELDEEGRTAVLDRAKDAVTKGEGAWGSVNDWGRRKLIYEIAKQKEAHYSLLEFDCTGDTLHEVVRQLRITDGVMRVMAVNRVKPAPADAELEKVTDEELAAGPPQRGRGRGGGRDRGGRGRDRD